MMLNEYSGKKKSEIVLFHSLLLSDFFGMMLGGSKSNLLNMEKIWRRSCLVFFCLRVWVLPCQWRLDHLLNSQD